MVVLYTASLILAVAVALPLWKPLLLAAALAAPLTSWHDRTARALGGRRTLSAALFTMAAVLIIVLPIAVAVLLVVDEALDLVHVVQTILQRKGVTGLLEPLPDQLADWLQHRYQHLVGSPRAVLSHLRDWAHAGWALKTLSEMASTLSNVLFSSFMMIVAIFFMLRDGHRLGGWLKKTSPLRPEDVDRLDREFSAVSRSIIGGNLATGAAQSVVATVGYLIAGAPSVLLLGLLTFLASFIPSVGTALIAVPIVGLLVLLGRGWWALFLAGWMLLVVGTIDNLLRPLLMRGGSGLQGSLVFFSLMGGILAFGAMGLVVGPVALALFLAMSAALRRAD